MRKIAWPYMSLGVVEPNPEAILEISEQTPGDSEDTARAFGKVLGNAYHTPEIPTHEAAWHMAEHVAAFAETNELTGEVQVLPDERVYEHAEPMENLTTEDYVNEVLKKNPEVQDTYNRPRPTYEMNGRTVVFRNRMEIVEIPDSGVTVVAADTVRPLSISKFKKEAKEHFRRPMAELSRFNQDHVNDNKGNILSVPNTPLGIVEAAIMLGAENIAPLRDKLLRGEYTDPECQKLIDGLLGATTVSDSGEALENYDTDGFAVVLSGLTGDESARRIVEAKSTALMRLETERKQCNTENAQRYVRERQERGIPLPEPLPYEKMFIVHSTQHELQFDAQGNAIFKPYGQYDDYAVLPRASWHATINSCVFPHSPQINEAEAWNAHNRLVVAPLTAVMRETPDRLEVVDGVDTWFVVGPGEEIKVPSPVIIEATTSGEELVQRHGNFVQFLFKEHYSEEEQEQIALFAGTYGAVSVDALKHKDTFGADTLKEACLQMVLSEQGLSDEERDRPATDGHGMANNLLAQRISAAAYSLGLRSGGHFYHSEKTFDEHGFSQVTDNLDQKLFGFAHPAAMPEYAVAIGARRQTLVNGCMPAAPQSVPVEDDQSIWA